MTTDLIMDALERVLYDRQPDKSADLIHHSDRGSQYASIKYTEWLGEMGIHPPVGSIGDAYDNALAETINGLYKTELIHRSASWKSKAAVELATLKSVFWFNHQRLLGLIGNIAPVEAKQRYYQQLEMSKNQTVLL